MNIQMNESHNINIYNKIPINILNIIIIINP